MGTSNNQPNRRWRDLLALVLLTLSIGFLGLLFGAQEVSSAPDHAAAGTLSTAPDASPEQQTDTPNIVLVLSLILCVLLIVASAFLKIEYDPDGRVRIVFIPAPGQRLLALPFWSAGVALFCLFSGHPYGWVGALVFVGLALAYLILFAQDRKILAAERDVQAPATVDGKSEQRAAATPVQVLPSAVRRPAPSAAFDALMDHGNLPSIPTTIAKVLRLIKEEAPKAKIGAAMRDDPAASHKLIEKANKVTWAPADPRQRITTPERAAPRLPLEEVRAIAAGATLIEESKKVRCEEFEYDLFWQECIARATAAEFVTAPNRKDYCPDEAFTLGLLSQIGRLVFASAKPDNYAEILRAAGPHQRKLRHLERQRFGINHYEVAARLISRAGMPDLFSYAVEFQDCLHDPVILPRESPERSLAHTLFFGGLIWETFWSLKNHDNCTLLNPVQECAVKSVPELKPGHYFARTQHDAVVQQWQHYGELLDVVTFQVPPWENVYPGE